MTGGSLKKIRQEYEYESKGKGNLGRDGWWDAKIIVTLSRLCFKKILK
jgi:hypothetical protein